MNTHIIHWSFDPILISLGPIDVRWYGVIWAVAFVLGEQILGRIYRAENRQSDEAGYLLIYTLIGTVVGARLAHTLIYEPGYYLTHPLAIIKTWQGGMASHGGAVGMLLSIWLYTRRFTVPSYLWLVDRITIPVALGAALVRIANFLGSDILGKPTSGTWGVVFDAIDSTPRHPVQLYEAAAYLAEFVLLLMLYRRTGSRTPYGLLTATFMCYTFSARFLLEFFKTPQASYEAGFAISVGQWLSVPFVLAGLLLFIHVRRASSFESELRRS